MIQHAKLEDIQRSHLHLGEPTDPGRKQRILLRVEQRLQPTGNDSFSLENFLSVVGFVAAKHTFLYEARGAEEGKSYIRQGGMNGDLRTESKPEEDVALYNCASQAGNYEEIGKCRPVVSELPSLSLHLDQVSCRSIKRFPCGLVLPNSHAAA